MMNDPAAYSVNVAQGLWSPVPWYYSFFVAAEKLNCRPWELVPGYGTDEGWTPPEFWYHAALIMVGAEQDHTEFRRKHPNLFK
jgi:hypothetical protein